MAQCWIVISQTFGVFSARESDHIVSEQMQHKMLDQLFAAYFEEELDTGCFDSLSNAAVKAGVFPTHTEVSVHRNPLPHELNGRPLSLLATSYLSTPSSAALAPSSLGKSLAQHKQFAEEVRMLVEDAGIKGIKGVPCTVINNTWVIQGAQIADIFSAVRNATVLLYNDTLTICSPCSSLSLYQPSILTFAPYICHHLFVTFATRFTTVPCPFSIPTPFRLSICHSQ